MRAPIFVIILLVVLSCSPKDELYPPTTEFVPIEEPEKTQEIEDTPSLTPFSQGNIENAIAANTPVLLLMIKGDCCSQEIAIMTDIFIDSDVEAYVVDMESPDGSWIAEVIDVERAGTKVYIKNGEVAMTDESAWVEEDFNQIAHS